MPTKPTLATKDPELLINRIKLAFPELSWKGYKFIDTGWDHEVIQLDNKYIFRFPNSPEYQAKLRDEIELLVYLGKHIKTKIPQYSYVPKDYSFGGYAMLEGNTLEPELLNKGAYELDFIAEEIAKFLSELHATETKNILKYNICREVDFAGYGNVAVEAEKYLKPNLEPINFMKIAEVLKEIDVVRQMPQPTCLIHGDIAPKHILWNPETRSVGFIDFSDRLLSDPAYDFAELYSYGKAFVDKVYSFYKSPHKNNHFLQRAKAYMQVIGIHSLANSYRTDKIQRKEAERLLNIGLALH